MGKGGLSIRTLRGSTQSKASSGRGRTKNEESTDLDRTSPDGSRGEARARRRDPREYGEHEAPEKEDETWRKSRTGVSRPSFPASDASVYPKSGPRLATPSTSSRLFNRRRPKGSKRADTQMGSNRLSRFLCLLRFFAAIQPFVTKSLKTRRRIASVFRTPRLSPIAPLRASVSPW